MKVVLFSLFSICLIGLSLTKNLNSKVNEEPRCCEVCQGAEKKYISIDQHLGHDYCGESCMDPKWYWLYKIFEWGMYEATTNTPCNDLGYSNYFMTETHGFWKITMKVDFLKKQK